eukprot:g2370.t1
MAKFEAASETVAVAETSAGGLISASLLSAPLESRFHPFRGAGVRLPHGLKPELDEEAKKTARGQAKPSWGVEYDGDDPSQAGTAVHALELAHAAKFNLGTDWGIGESGVPGPASHSGTGQPPGLGFVAVVGPTEETTGVLKINTPAETMSRMENMARFAKGALDLLGHLQATPR